MLSTDINDIIEYIDFNRNIISLSWYMCLINVIGSDFIELFTVFKLFTVVNLFTV